jgi:hypothetical protein
MDTPVGPIGGPGLEIPPGDASDDSTVQLAMQVKIMEFGFTVLQGAISDAYGAADDGGDTIPD